MKAELTHGEISKSDHTVLDPGQPAVILHVVYRLVGKRIFDILLSAIGLVVVSPLMLAICVLIRLSSSGRVFYTQDRVGRHGKLFRIVKFRSMTQGADRLGPLLTSSGDPRVNRVGTVLRRYKLDELPQLWNVLLGQMSLVGPRPETPGYAAGFTEEQRQVLSVRPGITDIASLLYRNEEAILANFPRPEEYYRQILLPHKLSLNLEYIDRMSFSYDLNLLLRTVRVVFVRSAARPGKT